MAVLDSPSPPDIDVIPERTRVCLRPSAQFDAVTMRHLEDEARALIGRGFDRLAIDLRGVETIDPGAAAVLNAISREARRNGARVTVIPGRSAAVRALRDAGLLGNLVLETPSEPLFFDWTL